MLLEVQHPVQAHAKVIWSLLNHQAFVIDKHVQFPFSFSVIEMIGGRNCLAYTKLNTPFPNVAYQESQVFVETLFNFHPRWASQYGGQVVSINVLPRCCFRKIADIDVKQHRREEGTLRDTILHSSEPTALSVAGVQYEAPV